MKSFLVVAKLKTGNYTTSIDNAFNTYKEAETFIGIERTQMEADEVEDFIIVEVFERWKL